MTTTAPTASAADNGTKLNSWTTSVENKSGAYVRKESQFRQSVTADGSSGFKAEKGRYHLYVSYACPWAHRTLIVRALKGLEDCISVTVVDWLLGQGGWNFTNTKDGCELDPINGFDYLRKVYELTDTEYSGNVTVPALFDRKTNRIVNNESSEIIRMLNSEFNEFCSTDAQRELCFYPQNLREEIDALNSWIYPTINNGVYKCGFAVKQEPYDKSFKALFESLDRVEEILKTKRYLTGDTLTEADIRLWTTLVRFDAVYVQHFKCNLKRIVDYPNIWGYTRELYQMPGVRETVNMEHIKNHYMQSHKGINPHSIVARGPLIDFDQPHGRGD
jgi:glutathionyl-hydroquinone reductase